MENDFNKIFLILPNFASIRFFQNNSNLELLKRIIEKGPEVGIHTIIHLPNFERWKKAINSISTIEQFKHRIALQMSADNSNAFIGIKYANLF
jgi:predicted secreted Zn-dependent protease